MEGLMLKTPRDFRFHLQESPFLAQEGGRRWDTIAIFENIEDAVSRMRLYKRKYHSYYKVVDGWSSMETVLATAFN